MAESKKRPFDVIQIKKVKVGHIFSNFELQEVDQILQGTMFRNHKPKISFSANHKPHFTDVHGILHAKKFRNPKPKISFSANTITNGHDKKTIEDRISKLPKDILLFIISILTMREGARTSILSTCWRNLWSESVSCLDLHYANMTGHDYPKSTCKKSLTNGRSNFSQRVDQVLQACRSSRLDALRVSFILGKESTAHIDKWIKFVATQGVKQLELDFTPYSFFGADADYKFDVQGPTSSLKYLYLKCCIFDSPTNLKAFSSLVSMTLDDVFLTEYAVQNILSSCSSLEWLSLKGCRFISSACLKFAGPSLLLKHLHISFSAVNVKKIDLHDINLLSFELHGNIQTLSIENAPHLTRLAFPDAVPVEVLTSVPHLEMLFMTGWFKSSGLRRYERGTLPRVCVFNNLKRLAFLANYGTPHLSQFVYLLEACPLLQKLELDMGISDTRQHRFIEELIKMTSIPGSPHTNLKEIDIYGFESFPEKIQLTIYLLKKSTVLEKMNIYTASRWYRGNGEWVIYENALALKKKEGRMSLKKFRKLLLKEKSSSTKLIIVSK